MIIQPSNLRLTNRGTVAANYTLSIIAGTPAAPGATLHVESGIIIANSLREFALADWADVPAGFAGFAKLESDQQLGFVCFTRGSALDCTVTDLSGVGGPVTVTYLAGDAPLTPTYEFTLPPGGSYGFTLAEFPPPGYTSRVEFSGAFGVALSHEAVVLGLVK